MSADKPLADRSMQMLDVMVRAAVHHAVEACIAATGQRHVINHFVNKTDIANEVMQAVREAAKEARNG